MQNTQPLVSILLPVYNAGDHLYACLKSLVKQTYDNIEIIAIDDKSSNNSSNILRSFRKQDKRIKIYRNIKHYGKALTLNRCVKRAKGNFLVFMAQNDVCSKKRITKQLHYLLTNPKICVIGAQCLYIDDRNKKVGASAFPQENDAICKMLVPGIGIQFESTMINRQLLPKDLLYFNTKAPSHLYQDIIIKIVKYGKMANLSEILHYHRKTYEKEVSTIQEFLSLTKTWIRTAAVHNHRLSLRSLFVPLVK